MTQLTLDNQLCFSLYSASNAVIRLYRPMLEPFGLTYPQYLLMLALWERDNVLLRELTVTTRLDAGTLSPIVKRLEGKGLLERRADPDDERAKRVVLTREGQALKAPLGNALRCLFEHYADMADEMSQLKSLCDNLLKRINQE